MHECVRSTGVIIVWLIGVICLISIFGIGIAMKVITGNAVIVSGYSASTCTITSGMVMNVSKSNYCSEAKYVAVWRTIQGYSVIESPISSSRSYPHALKELDDYPLNTALDCVCDFDEDIIYPNVDIFLPCTFYGRCFLNLEIVEYIKTQLYFNAVGTFFIVISVLSLVLMIVFAGFSCKNRCCRKKNYVDLDEV